MAADIFIKIDGIKGESQNGAQADEIVVLSWSWGASMAGVLDRPDGGGGSRGRASVTDLTFAHYTDRATPNLLKTCLSGKHIKDATLTVKRAGGDSEPLMTVKMHPVMVTSVNLGGSADGDRMVEQVTLNFAKVEIEYHPAKSDGKNDGAVPMTWDIAGNSPSV